MLGLVAAGCPSQPPPRATPKAKPKPPVAEEKVVWRLSKSGLGFRLSDADPAPPPVRKIAKAKALSAAEVKKLSARLPQMKAEPSVKDFAVRGKSLPAPRPGKTFQTTFPPAIRPPAPAPPRATGPLEVTRWSPDGDVGLAPHLSVTFNEPMVDITSHAELDKKTRPVRLTPEPPGKWRWIGTQTLLFEPKERFPASTDYQVEVPAEARSVNGATLGQSKRWSFTTPRLELLRSHPRWSGIELDPIVFLSFNQRINQEALLAHLSMRAGQQPVDFRMATADEIEEDRAVRRMSQDSEPGRWIALRASGDLPKDTPVEVVLKAGATSAEGPNPTERDLESSFRTYGPMRFVELECHWRGPCPPLAPWAVEFSNQIDPSSFDKSMVTIEPELVGARFEVSGRRIRIRGASKGRTTYKVRLDGPLKDEWGQVLEAPVDTKVDVVSAEPVLFGEQERLIVLDPAFGPKLSVFSVNRKALKVRLYKVLPADFEGYIKWRRLWDNEQKHGRPPGRLAKTQVVQTRKAPDELVETPIDLGPALTDGVGQVLAIVETTTPPKRDRWGNTRKEWARVWVQVTKIGLQAFVDDSNLFGWASSLSDGSPLEGVDVSVLPRLDAAKTGADGIAKFPLGGSGDMIYAQKGKDTVILPGRSYYYYGDSVTSRSRSDSLRWFTFDDRQLYKPGESVNVKGWLRILGVGKNGDVGALPTPTKNRVRYEVRGPRSNEIAKGSVDVDDSGGFHLSVQLPKNANLGQAQVRLELEGPSGGAHNRSSYHHFQIQEFRRPEFEVTASSSAGPHFVGKHAVVTVEAKYFAGGGLPDAEVGWRVHSKDTQFVPPNRSGFHFGKARSFWWWGRKEKPGETETWKARTAAGGEHRLRVDFDGLTPAFSRNIELQATVTDVNRQAWTARSSIMLHPGSYYVGLRRQGSFVRAGQKIALDLVVSDLDGNSVPDRQIVVKSSRIQSKWVAGEVEETEVDTETCEVVSTETLAACRLPTRSGGLHKVLAEVTDQHGRKSHSEMRVYVLGADGADNPKIEQDKVTVIPNKEEYAGGESAELLVLAPFYPAEGVLTLRRDGVVELRRFRMEKPTTVLTVPVDPRWVPNIGVRVDLVGARVRENESGDPDPSLPKRPAFAAGSARLKVPADERTLAIEVSPKKKQLAPGATTHVSLSVKDATGAPAAGARATVIVVDEAVLALAGYQLPDPIEFFYSPRGEKVRDFETRFRVALMRPDTARMQVEAENKKDVRNDFGDGGLGAVGGGAPRAQRMKKKEVASKPMAKAVMAPPGPPPPPGASAAPAEDSESDKSAPEPALTVRSDFRALAAFYPSVKTDAQGRATVRVEVPDNLTRYRVMAIAAHKTNRFGSSENTITARLPLMVRPSLPRFLNYGDRFELPVVLQNQTSKPFDVDVVARAANARLTAQRGLRVTVPANDRVEVRFPAAAKRPGTARFQIGAVSRVGADASEHEIPVWTPATSEAFATYGQVDEGAVSQRVLAPSGVVTEFGGLEVTTTSTALQGLTDAVLYLYKYPFECNEQLSSRVIAIAALRDVLSAFKAEGLPPKKELVRSIQEDVKLLKARQHYTGGWDWWRRDRRPTPYVSIHVTHALVRAKQKGFTVPEDTLQQALGFLGRIRSFFPSWYSQEVRWSLESYALFVRNLAGKPDAKAAKNLIREARGVKKLPIEALGWLLPVLKTDAGAGQRIAEIRRHLANRVAETAGKAHFVTSYADGAHVLLHSDRRADGVLLEAMIGDDPENDVIPKIVKGLLAHRKRGRWRNTQENAFVLLALDRYFNTYEKVTPDFVARAWLGETFAGEHKFHGRSTDRQHVDIPMKFLARRSGPQNLVLQKEGPGRLYYRVGMQYAPKDLKLPPADHGFAVSREYEAADEPDEVKRDSSGRWRVKLGARVRVRVSMVARARRYHVALVDPLPAGFEPMNPALATTGDIPDDPKSKQSGRPWWWSRAWYEHQNMRDERVEAFASLLWDGVYDYTYVARATTPGTFVVPPSKAEEMYSPETFGRSAGDIVIVE